MRATAPIYRNQGTRGYGPPRSAAGRTTKPGSSRFGRGTGRLRAPKRSALLGGLSIGACVIFFLLLFMIGAQARNVLATATSEAGLIAGIQALQGYAYLALAMLVLGLVLGIVGIAMKTSVTGVAITGTILNGLALLWYASKMVG